jgi:hypothetical protein
MTPEPATGGARRRAKPDATQSREDPPPRDLLARISRIEDRVRAVVARRRGVDLDPDDRFRGLYISDREVDGLLDGDGARIWNLVPWSDVSLDDDDAPREPGRLSGLAASFGLDGLDIELLLIALAPDIDPRFERLYGYLHDDVSRRRASIGLALELCGVPPFRGDARARLSRTGPLVMGSLVIVEDGERPMLTRSLRVPDRVAAHLLGHDATEPDVRAVMTESPTVPAATRWVALQRALEQRISPVYLRQSGMASGMTAAATEIRAHGSEAILVDITRLTAAAGPQLVTALIREARLREAVLVAGVISDTPDSATELLAPLGDAPCRVILVGERPWDPNWSTTVPLVLSVPQPTPAERTSVWRDALDGDWPSAEASQLDDLIRGTVAFRLSPAQQVRATRAGLLRARAEGRRIASHDLQAGARSQNAAGLDRLGHRVEAAASWQDLVVPAEVGSQLGELTARARQRERVLDEWRIGGRAARGRGITALFSGESGTGKTLAAEVVAGELGLDLYVIDLSTVVDKYIGETEKNLDRIFREADRVNAVLLFDEADAIFGKRSEVRDARDRYANLEVSYLLQRMERFDGLAVLTTNLRANLDEAFTRRIDVIVDFPMPEDEHRLALWQMHLPDSVPQAPDLDLDFMAHRFRLSGGNIRNVCMTAAFLAADAERPVTMADLIRGTEREYRKLGRLTVEAEFGPYLRIAAKSIPT